MNKERSLLALTTDTPDIGLYDTLKSLCQKYSDKITSNKKSNAKKLLIKSYEVLLNKVDSNFKAVPSEWSDEDILNALYLHIHENVNDEEAQKVCKKFHILYENQRTEIYQNSVGPIIRMLYSIAMNQTNHLKEKKFCRQKKNIWFDTDVISQSLNSFEKYLPRDEMKFFALPKIHSSQSDSNLFHRPVQLPSSLTFDNLFKKGNQQEKLSYDLDEGFVTPSEDHKERSPCLDKKIIIPPTKLKQFDWDLKVVGVPARKDKSWEKLDLPGRNKELPFVPREVLLQHWLSKAPHSITKISRKQLIEDIMSLLIGVPSTTFSFNGNTFQCKAGIYTDHHTAEDVIAFTKQYIEAAEAFLALKKLSEKNLSDDIITSAFKLAVQKYLYKYQLIVYHIINGRISNKAYLSDIQLLIEQVICLKTILVQQEELKGVTLLEQLFNHMETSSTQMFYLLTSLFLQPCLYYFRLVDDWIFLGKWHKDLPISSSDFSLIKDRQTWEEAYKPLQCNFLWFIPVQDLAYCGKALSLLSVSKNSEKFLKILKSDDRPRVKLCLHLDELKGLKMDCHDFYERAKSSFHIEKKEELDLVSCAQNLAKIKAQTFEELKKEENDYEKERKRKELNLREEDLIRSAKVKELRKQEEQLDNIRVAEELESMHLKQEKREFEKAKEIYDILKQEQAKEEKEELKAEWKLKRQQNNKKRLEMFNDESYMNDNLIHTKGESKESVLVDQLDKALQNKDDIDDTIRAPTESPLLENNEKMVEGQEEISDDNDVENEKDKACNEIKLSELEENRLKVLGSNIIVGYDVTTSDEVDKKYDKNASPSNELNLIETVKKDDHQIEHSELERNRMKALHSDFGRGSEAVLLVYQDQAGKNKEKILGSHFTLGSDSTDKKILNDNENIVIDEDKIEPSHKEVTDEDITESNDLKENISQHSLDQEDIRPADVSRISNLSNTSMFPATEEQTDSPHNRTAQPTSEDIGVKRVNWFQNCNRHVEGVKNLFKADDLINVPEQRLDYCSILRCISGSLNLVLETQLKLVNEALLEMFLNEFELLSEAGKLKKYFFLDEEFGKRLTCTLCPAIEKERPSTLLTFGKLRDVIAFASQGDEKLSFIVKETPTAFELTNPQALSCLGLSYKITWPLNLIFTDIAMSKYNDVFEYMLSLRRVSWHLDQVWLLLKFRSSEMKGHEYTQIQLYRHIMSQFVCSLQWYICTTVFENSWQKFNGDVKEVTNFQELYRKHAAYLKEVIFKCFLNEKSSGLMKKMQSLLKYVLIFCQVMRFGEWSISESGDYQHCNFKKLQNTFSSFLKLAKYIIRQIEKLVKINYQDGLVNLYNLLTINSFYLT